MFLMREDRCVKAGGGNPCNGDPRTALTIFWPPHVNLLYKNRRITCRRSHLFRCRQRGALADENNQTQLP
jgi:hypothetical protein